MDTRAVGQEMMEMRVADTMDGAQHEMTEDSDTMLLNEGWLIVQLDDPHRRLRQTQISLASMDLVSSGPRRRGCACDDRGNKPFFLHGVVLHG
jgi:hypothetical protein